MTTTTHPARRPRSADTAPASLDPPSSLLWAYENVHAEHANRVAIARCSRPLDRELLASASKALIDRHPVLASRVLVAHSGSGHRYFRKRLDDPGASIIEWNALSCDQSALEERLREIESVQLNARIDPARSRPLRIFVHECNDRLTHLQLVVPAALFDDRSAALLLGDLLAAYVGLQAPPRPPLAPPAPMPRDWEAAFDCRIPLSIKSTLHRLVERDESSHRRLNTSPRNDERDWTNLIRFLGAAAQGEGRESQEFDCFPRRRRAAGGPDTAGAERMRMLAHAVAGDQLSKLEALAGGSGDQLEAPLEAAMVRAQLDVEGSNDGDRSSRVLTLMRVVDLRPFVIEPQLAGSVGNLAAGVPTAVPIRDQGLLKTSNFLFFLKTQRANALRGWRDILQSFLLWHHVRAAVSEEFLESYLRVFSPQPLVHGQVVISHLGPLERFLDPAVIDRLGLERFDVAGKWPGRLSVLSYRFGGQLRVNAVYPPLFADPAQAEMLWDRFRAGLAALAGGA